MRDRCGFPADPERLLRHVRVPISAGVDARGNAGYQTEIKGRRQAAATGATPTPQAQHCRQ